LRAVACGRRAQVNEGTWDGHDVSLENDER
jgi:hypothetical protein